MRKLSQKGVAIIYISHRLQELKEISNTVSVLRDGELVGTMGIDLATVDNMAKMMFGGVIRKTRPPELEVQCKPVMEVRKLSRRSVFQNVTFQLYEGEVLGIAGMVGSGRTELLRSIFGDEPFDEGEVVLDQQVVTNPSPAKMKKLGVGFVPENRKEVGLIEMLSVRENICLAGRTRISFRGIIWKSRERAVAQKMVDKLDIAVSNMELPVSSLSGGNQQKVVLGNWLNTRPRIMLLDEPTRGIDLYSKQQIFQIIWSLSRGGISSIFVSSELEELVGVCHRLLVMREGRIVDEVRRAEGFQVEKLLALSMGN